MAFEFTEKQNEMLRAGLDEAGPQLVIAVGGIRSGKTVGGGGTLLIDGLRRHVRGRSAPYILGGKSIGAVRRNVFPGLRMVGDHLGLLWDYRSTVNELSVGPVNFVLFGGSTEESQEAVSGMTAAGALVNEATYLRESFVKQVVMRCSEPGAKVIIDTNPGAPSHWIKKEFVDENVGVVLGSTVDDNPHIGDKTKAFYRSVLTGHYAARMLDNEWAGAVGLVYPRWQTWDEETDGTGTTDMGVDWGTSSVTAAVKVVERETDDGTVWVVVDEYYHVAGEHGERTSGEHADALAEFWGPPEKVGEVICDPSAAALRLDLRRRGVGNRSGNNAVLDGIDLVRGLLAVGDVRVHPRCRRLIAELQTYEWDARATERGEDAPVKRNDHALDALRYWAMRRFRDRRRLDRVWTPKPVFL